MFCIKSQEYKIVNAGLKLSKFHVIFICQKIKAIFSKILEGVPLLTIKINICFSHFSGNLLKQYLSAFIPSYTEVTGFPKRDKIIFIFTCKCYGLRFYQF